MAIEEFEKKEKELQVKVKAIEDKIKIDNSMLEKEKILLEIRQEAITKLESSITSENDLLTNSKKELESIINHLIELKKDEIESTTDPTKLREIAKNLKRQLEIKTEQERKEAETINKTKKVKKHFWSGLFKKKTSDKIEKKDNKFVINKPNNQELKENISNDNQLMAHVVKALEKPPQELIKVSKKQPLNKQKSTKTPTKSKTTKVTKKVVKNKSKKLMLAEIKKHNKKLKDLEKKKKDIIKKSISKSKAKK